jgi:hypothetical protein
MNPSAVLRLLARRVPLLLAFLLAAVFAAPAAGPVTPAGATTTHAVAASASAPTTTATVHVDADRSSTAPVPTAAMPQVTIAGAPTRTLRDNGPRAVPVQRGPPALSA